MVSSAPPNTGVVEKLLRSERTAIAAVIREPPSCLCITLDTPLRRHAWACPGFYERTILSWTAIPRPGTSAPVLKGEIGLPRRMWRRKSECRGDMVRSSIGMAPTPCECAVPSQNHRKKPRQAPRFVNWRAKHGPFSATFAVYSGGGRDAWHGRSGWKRRSPRCRGCVG